MNTFQYRVGSDTFLNTHGTNRDEQIVLYNLSSTAFTLQFADFTTAYLPAWWAKSFRKSNPIGIVSLSSLYVLPKDTAATNIIYGELYETNEHIADINVPLEHPDMLEDNTLIDAMTLYYTDSLNFTVNIPAPTPPYTKLFFVELLIQAYGATSTASGDYTLNGFQAGVIKVPVIIPTGVQYNQEYYPPEAMQTGIHTAFNGALQLVVPTLAGNNGVHTSMWYYYN